MLCEECINLAETTPQTSWITIMDRDKGKICDRCGKIIK